MYRYTVKLTYGRTLWYIRDLHADSIEGATTLARLLFPRASTITVE
jgi:hypothetical protein